MKPPEEAGDMLAESFPLISIIEVTSALPERRRRVARAVHHGSWPPVRYRSRNPLTSSVLTALFSEPWSHTALAEPVRAWESGRSCAASVRGGTP